MSAGPTLSFKGLDNARSYYRLLTDDKPRIYVSTILGTGNTLNREPSSRNLEMVTDSSPLLGATRCNIDGFRFDLGTILAREPNGFDNRKRLF